MFSGCTVLPDSKETELGSSNQEVSSAASKNARVVLVSCQAWKCVPTVFSGDADISMVSGCHHYSHAWSCSLCEGRTSSYMGLISRKLYGILLILSTGFTSLSVLHFFPSINHLLHLYAWFLILFDQTQMRFSQSTNLLFLFGDFNVLIRIG